MLAVEMHYTVGEVSLLLRMSERWVRDRIQAGEFGDTATDGPVLIGGTDWRIPASGINRYLAGQRPLPSPGVPARNRRELRAKARAGF